MGALHAESRRAYRQAFLSGFRPDPRITVSQWADRHRILTRRSSSEPGPWRTDRTPYLREIMDSLSSTSGIERVVFMKGSQIGGTEVLNNWLGYVIDHAPGPYMAVMPTEGVQRRKSRQTLDPLIEDTPRLAEKVTAKKSRDPGNTTLMKTFPGGILVLASAQSAADLRSMPVRYLALDEVDAYPDELDDEGDPVDLAERGTRTYRHRKKVYVTSTPTSEHRSRIARAFRLTDRRHFEVPCPHCDGFQRIEWGRITWDGADSKDPLEQVVLDLEEGKREAWLVCLHCEERIDEHHKTQMLARGVWVPEVPERGRRVRGYALSALYSPHGMYSWASSVARFLKAQGRPELLRVWVNQDLGETWKDKGEAPDWERLYRLRETYPTGIVPEGAYVVTAGVDVQGDRIELEVVGWGPDHESWSIDYRVHLGAPSGTEVWEELDRLLAEEFEREDDEGPALRVASLAIDAGAYTQDVYRWVRKFGKSLRVHAVRGRTGVGTFIGIPTMVDVVIAGRRIPRGARSWPVDSGMGKEELYGWLAHEPPLEEGDPFPPGYCHFPQYGQEFFKNLTSEVLVRRRVKSGRIVLDWEVMPGRRNETLDCRVYARAAAAILGMDRWGRQDWDAIRTGVVSGPAPAQPEPERRRYPSGRWRRRLPRRT